MSCECHIEAENNAQKRVLMILLLINVSMFVLEMGVGWFAQSTALMADALDMCADAIVYAIGLYAVGRSVQRKANAALISGYFQMTLGLSVLINLLYRLVLGSAPVSAFMIGMGLVALIANVICLLLIRKHKDGDVHMQASWIFSANDVIANLGVIISGVLVYWLDARWPDFVIGLLISLIVLRGAWQIVQIAKRELAVE